MSKRNELNRAVKLTREGKYSEARDAILRLEPDIRDPQMRVLLIDIAMNALHNVQDNLKKTELSLEGAQISESIGRIDYQAHFLGRAADFIMFRIGFLYGKRKGIKLTPGWFGYATEAEKNEYDSLTQLISQLDAQVDDILSKAIALSKLIGDKRAQASVLMSLGSVEATRYLRYKMDCIGGIRAKLWSRFELFRYPFFEYVLNFWSGDSKKLAAYVRAFKKCFLESGGLYEEINDPLAGGPYYNLALHLKSSYRFRSAKKYLEKANALALRYNDTALRMQIQALRKSIKLKNRDHFED